jgi:hypothetical protein
MFVALNTNLQQRCIYAIVFLSQGSFPKNEFSFKIYIPAARRIEDSQIPND